MHISDKSFPPDIQKEKKEQVNISEGSSSLQRPQAKNPTASL